MAVKKISVPVEISPELLVALGENEQGLKTYFQAGIAIMLFQEEKLTIGKAVQLSGLTRYEFEKALAKRNIPISNPSLHQIFADAQALAEL